MLNCENSQMSSKKSTQNQVIDLHRPHVCGFCNKSFVREHSLVSHMCEPRRRHESRNNSDVKKAFWAYDAFYKHLNPQRKDQPRTYQEFSQSVMYGTLVKFGAWCEQHLVQEWQSYVKWLIERRVKIDNWCDLHAYAEYLQDLINNEPAEQALSRSLATVTHWSERSGKPWQEFFVLVNCHQLVSWVQQGRISAWLLYNSPSAQQALHRCTPEQLHMINHVIPAHKWKIRFLRMTADADLIRTLLTQAGL